MEMANWNQMVPILIYTCSGVIQVIGNRWQEGISVKQAFFLRDYTGLYAKRP